MSTKNNYQLQHELGLAFFRALYPARGNLKELENIKEDLELYLIYLGIEIQEVNQNQSAAECS